MRWWFNFRVPYTESFINELNEDITFILIPIDRDNKEVIWNENSLLKLLLSEHFEKSTSRRDNLTPKVKRVASELERVGLIKIQEAIEKKYTLNKDFKFVFNFDSQIDYSLLLDQINIEINEKGLKYNITESGSGIQSLTIIAMYRYLAELRHKNIMLGIEEPKINLHPQAQREFIKGLKESSSEVESQIIFTTHSSIIVDQLEHEEIVLFRKVEDNIRGFKTIVNQIPNNFFERYNLQEQQYYKFYRYKNSDFFFFGLCYYCGKFN
ncbi:ATP-dependent nuclease [Paracerasibacillus soli]|uniref:AAA family ATPase n=1 Tax=Paracerasibacillus soli TaxID=480284 RepID=A0ABU5CTN4_9BACI|nr:AAA family ATPase [Virgibacillus soli]MDY0409729.1 AAA family ATPase [Virgibacillus soli]